MNVTKRFLNWLTWIPEIPNPDEQRRRYFLVRMTLAVLVGALLLICVALVQYWNFGQVWLEGLWEVFSSGIVTLCGCLVILAFSRNHNISGWGLGVAFLLLMVVGVSISDAPRAVINGRSLVTWVLPIAAAPLILPSKSAFFAATLSAITIIGMAVTNQININYYAIAFFYVLAFAVWLSARALENALAEARREAEKYQAVIEGVSDGIVVVDPAGKIIDANPAAQLLLNEGLEMALTEGRTNFRERVLEFSWSQVPGVGRAAIVRDITRQVEVERAKDALLGTVSHELRTPLSAISGFAEVIGMVSEVPKITEMARRIRVNVGRLKGLINSLLDQAQIQAGAFKLRVDTFELLKLTNEVSDLMAGMAQDKGLLFSLLIQEGTPQYISGDFERIRQVFVNLLGNAIKFTDQGSVTVQVYSLPEARWGFSVADTGDGIPAARLPDIFEPFRRGSDYAVRNRQGAGLGLSISRQLVELMGGQIEAQSEIGQGTVFTVTLPEKIQENEVSNEQ